MSSDLIQAIRAQSKFSISKAISLIENQREDGHKLLSDLFQYTGNANRIGITGAPGVGKSSLTNNLITAFKRQDKTVAVIAVDPTSKFSGGAVLGDRIRMNSHHTDPNVFVRSMATRGSQGGLALQTEEVGEIFDAAQYDVIIFETVGVGQIELDIIQAVDSVIVVLVPESGDEVQMMKAGLMEIGNIFAINKSDRPGANKLKVTLNNLLSTLTIDQDIWKPEVILTTAIEGHGIDNLISCIESHESFNKKYGIQRRKSEDRYKRRVKALINAKINKSFWDKGKKEQLITELHKEPLIRISPYLLARKLLNS